MDGLCYRLWTQFQSLRQGCSQMSHCSLSYPRARGLCRRGSSWTSGRRRRWRTLSSVGTPAPAGARSDVGFLTVSDRALMLSNTLAKWSVEHVRRQDATEDYSAAEIVDERVDSAERGYQGRKNSFITHWDKTFRCPQLTTVWRVAEATQNSVDVRGVNMSKFVPSMDR